MIAVTLISAMLGYAIVRSAHIGAKIVLVFLVCGLMVPSILIRTPITQILRFLNPLIILGLTSGTTVAVGVCQAIGEHSSDLGALLGFMSLASVPVLIFFPVFQRHFAKGLTGGATK